MKKIIFALLICFYSTAAFSQFYNGLETNFGKNRVQYNNFVWRYFQHGNNKIFFYDRGVNLGKFVNDIIENQINKLQEFYGVQFDEPLIFIIYNNLRDFKQTNIGLPSNSIGTLAAQTQIIDNKIFVFYNGTHKDLKQQLRKVISEVIFNKVVYGNYLTKKIIPNTDIELPEWFKNGIISFSVQSWSPSIENRLKDIFLHKKHINFNTLKEQNAIVVGHSFWYFVSENYGQSVITSILYFTKLYKDVNKAFEYVTGISLKEAHKQWYQFFKQYFEKQNLNAYTIDNKPMPIKTKKNTVYQNFAVSPNGEYAAYSTNQKGKFKIFIYNFKTKKKKKIFKQGYKLDQITDYSYPLLTWDKNGKRLAFITEKKNSVILNIYKLENKELKQHNLLYIDKVLWLSYSPNNRYIVLSAYSKGFTDLFVFDFYTSQMRRLTYDLADDLFPSFLPNSKQIVFTSNRTDTTNNFLYNYEDNPKPQNFYDLYTINIKTGKIKRYTKTPTTNETMPFAITNTDFIYLSDSTGIISRNYLTTDSSIAFVDTIIHYFYFFNTKQISNYPVNINKQQINKNYLSEIIFFNKKDNLHYNKVNKKQLKEINLKNPLYSNLWRKFIEEQKTQIINEQKKIKKQKLIKAKIDSLKPKFDTFFNTYYDPYVNISNYKFEFEKDTLFKIYYFEKLKHQKKQNNSEQKYRVYFPIFYITDFGGDFNFTPISQTYQTFTGGPYYFNTGMKYLTKVQIDELFEDYRLIGAFRFDLFNKNYEYLISIENLKKRLDKQLIYFRASHISVNDTYYVATKNVVNQLNYILSYPFNQVLAFKTTPTLRYERFILLSRDYSTLTAKDDYSLYVGLKNELIFDNTRTIEHNLYDGIRWKIFNEIYKQANFGNSWNQNYWIDIYGFDFRFYQEIFRHSIFATRIAGSGSTGSAKLVYYLGGVDNWITIFNNRFNYDIIINTKENYIFQAVATNMRGFRQNIRNGSHFLVSNTELRIPILRLITGAPISSPFLRSIQAVGFFDAGTAWAGLSPWDKDANAYNKQIVHRGVITIKVDVERPPVVFGYGAGVRFKLFGYYIRLDWAWGIEGYQKNNGIFYFSFADDF